MKNKSEYDKQLGLFSQILDFVEQSKGLEAVGSGPGQVKISQSVDGKFICIPEEQIEEVLVRADGDQKTFLQVNFKTGRKILVTESLIGFKPAHRADLDMGKLPKVVTTPDLISVVEAIEDAMSAEGTLPEEIEVLKKVFECVMRGGEQVGFDLKPEKLWLQSLFQTQNKASA